MTQFFRSFFGKENQSLWENPTSEITLDQSKVIFQDTLSIIEHKTKQWKSHFFILTKKNLFCVESQNRTKIVAVLPTQFVRVELVKMDLFSLKESVFCIKLFKNNRFSELYAHNQNSFETWAQKMNSIFIQSNFHEKFKTIEMLGKGSFARVYRTEQKDTLQKFAVKTFSKKALIELKNGKMSLENEIKIMQKLEHKNITSLIEVHETKNSIYMVIDLLEGPELIQVLIQDQVISEKAIKNVIKLVGEALQHFQEKGILHRDLKPENIILQKDEPLEEAEIKIVDFGLSCELTNSDFIFQNCGTPGYIAPEIINIDSHQNKPKNEKCDVFSLGIISYMMATKSLVFRGRNEEEVYENNKHCNIDFSNPELRKNLLLFDLIKKMLEVDPDKRLSVFEILNHQYFGEKNEPINASQIIQDNLVLETIPQNSNEEIKMTGNLLGFDKTEYFLKIIAANENLSESRPIDLKEDTGSSPSPILTDRNLQKILLLKNFTEGLKEFQSCSFKEERLSEVF